MPAPRNVWDISIVFIGSRSAWYFYFPVPAGGQKEIPKPSTYGIVTYLHRELEDYSIHGWSGTWDKSLFVQSLEWDNIEP